MNLTEFLTARIAEVEAQARRIQAVGSCEPAYSPARVLAECEAKRRIVELCAPGDWSSPYWHSLGEPGEDDRGDVLALLALPYVEHPDYQENWRP